MSGPASAGSALTHSEALERLERSERGLRQLVDNATHPTLLIGHDGLIVRANPAVGTLLGHVPADLEGTPIEALIAPSSRASHRERREVFAADPPTGPVGTVRAVALGRDGREVPVEIGLSGLDTADGPVMCATLRDISPDLRLERQKTALRRIAAAAGPDLPVEALLAMVVREAAALLGADKALVGRFDHGDTVIVGSHGDHHTGIGDRIPSDSGSSLAAVARTGDAATVSYDDLPEGDPIRELALSQDHHHAVAVPITVHNRLWGGLMVAATQAVPADALDALSRFAEYAGAVIGAAESRASAKAVRASEAQLRAALDAGRMGAWTFDADGGAVRVDHNVRALFGIGDDVPEAEIRGIMAERMHPDDRERIGASIAGAIGGLTPEYHEEFRILLPGGGVRSIETQGQVARDGAGGALMVTGVLVDVTESRQAGERLLRSQKLEALGTLAGGIAHDFNNLLQVVGGNVAIARADLPEGHRAQEPLGTVELAAQRAADLVDRILSFSRPDDGTGHGALAMVPLVEEALDLLRPTLPAMIDLRLTAEEDLPRVSGDPTGITQVVTNLATNAAQAIGRRPGLIEFRVEAVTLAAEELQRAPELTEGAYVLLTVSDDGPGIAAETLPLIFDPFFTTKPPGQGTGLGLSIVHSLMRAHGGAVTVYSVPGTGTAFNLYFPVDTGPAAPALPPGEAPAAGGRRGRILFVDDEQDLVALNERSLGRVGHTVTGFTNPCEALELFRADPSAFDAVVTDLSMPLLSGLELTREVLALRPDIPVLIASGFIPPDERAEAEALGVREILPKPSPIARLRDALDTALGG